MLIIRRAGQNDQAAVLRILKNKTLDLYYAKLEYRDFWVAKLDGKIIGAVKLEEHKDFFWLEALGVLPKYQGQGISRQLIETAAKNIKKDIYLYTIIPEYFKKLGFIIPSPSLTIPACRQARPHFPSKSRYECKFCLPDKCTTMVRKYHAI